MQVVNRIKQIERTQATRRKRVQPVTLSIKRVDYRSGITAPESATGPGYIGIVWVESAQIGDGEYEQ